MMTEARDLTLVLGGRWYGRYGTAPCPVCQPERRTDQNALTLSDGRVGLLAHCKKLGCGFSDILAASGISQGDNARPDPAVIAKREAERRAEADRKSRLAKTLWDEAHPITGTFGETYLRGRGITCDLPETLRFHPEAWHGTTARRWPALVARVDGANGYAVHRTYLKPDGSGKAPIDPAKAMLGATAGGAVRLSDAGSRLVVAEGVETALSLLSGLLSGPACVWAALSTSGMAALRLPDVPRQLTIAPDGDTAGRAAALALADQASRDGWSVTMLTPPVGGDFNDLLRREVPA